MGIFHMGSFNISFYMVYGDRLSAGEVMQLSVVLSDAGLIVALLMHYNDNLIMLYNDKS